MTLEGVILIIQRIPGEDRQKKEGLTREGCEQSIGKWVKGKKTVGGGGPAIDRQGADWNYRAINLMHARGGGGVERGGGGGDDARRDRIVGMTREVNKVRAMKSS